MTEAKVICDSISDAGARITTVQIKFHRFELPALDTHRAFSRNFSSSRAIPTKKFLEQIRNEPAMPVWWGKNQAGMQANEELVGEERQEAIDWWEESAWYAARQAERGAALGVHKQIVNRVVEPFMWVEGIVTATDWDNFFELRCHPDAQPEIRVLAEKIKEVRIHSTPNRLNSGEWHLPYITEEDRKNFFVNLCMYGSPTETLAKVSAARCCRVSYLKHDGTSPNLKEDLALFERLAGGVPIHASPLEHQAEALPDQFARSRNFSGWRQFREIWETMPLNTPTA